MPDFERLTDRMSVDLAKTPEERARAEGRIAGKREARRQIAAIALVGAVIWIVVAVLVFSAPDADQPNATRDGKVNVR
jgi:ferric-dicitrate binding protein FerR (iron transport regulator)